MRVAIYYSSRNAHRWLDERKTRGKTTKTTVFFFFLTERVVRRLFVAEPWRKTNTVRGRKKLCTEISVSDFLQRERVQQVGKPRDFSRVRRAKPGCSENNRQRCENYRY